jgi:hypothetical protein
MLGALSDETKIVDINLTEYDLNLSFVYPFEENYIGPRTGHISAGDVVVKATTNKLEKLSSGKFKNYQISFATSSADMRKGFDFTLQSLLTDSSGRIIYIK